MDTILARSQWAAEGGDRVEVQKILRGPDAATLIFVGL